MVDPGHDAVCLLVPDHFVRRVGTAVCAAMTTPKYEMRELAAGIGQPHLIINEAFKLLDALAPRGVGSVLTISAPPDPDLAGRVHIVGPSPTGLWVGHYAHIAYWLNTGGWKFKVPKKGMMMWDIGNAAMVVYVGDDSAFAQPWMYLAS